MRHHIEQGMPMPAWEDDWDEQEAMIGAMLVGSIQGAEDQGHLYDSEQDRLSARREREFHRSQLPYDTGEDQS